jgi:hypothetical protein
VGPHPGGGRLPHSVTGTGDYEVAAIGDLDARLRGQCVEGPTSLEALRARVRLSYVAGAEEWIRTEFGRPMTDAEVERVIERFPG